MSNDSNKQRKNQLLRELKKSENVGHIQRIHPIYVDERNQFGSGIEILLSTKITPAQIRKVVNYIVKTYNFDSYYFTKSHSIKVIYRDVK
jgi:hypothetical protein